jgi:ATP-dependent protease ClpP protease subunit
MLSFTEKRSLQKTVATNLTGLAAGGVAFQDKRRMQKEISDAIVKLGEKALEVVPPVDPLNPVIEPVEPKTEQTNQRLADLIAGQYNTLEPLAFLGILKDISVEINDFEPLKDPAIKYIEANQDKAGAIMESAFREVFGKMWGDVATSEQMVLEAAGRGRTKAMLMPMPAAPSSSPIMVEGGNGAPLKITIEIDGDFTEPATFRDRIQVIESAKTGEEIILRINSVGGSTMSAQAFYSALLKTKARTKAVLINAYSSGSIVAMACDEVELTPFCSLMIHNASGGTGGKLGDMAGYATFKNDYIAEWFAQLYAGFLTEEELKDVAKGQDFWLKETQIRERLKNWEPIRKRLQADGSVSEI